MTDSAMLALVRKAWADTLSTAPSDAARTWEEAGADSLASLQLLLRLEKALGRKLSFDVIDPGMTASELARSIEATLAGESAPVSATMFLLPGVFGDEPILASFRRSFVGRLRFELVELPDLGEAAAVLRDIVATGRFAADEIQRRRPHGDILLGGFSFGGSIAFEAARHLVAAGRMVRFLVILDTAFEWDAGGGGHPRLPMSRRLVRGALSRAGGLDAVRRLMVAGAARSRPGLLFRLRRALLRGFRLRALREWRPAPLGVETLLVASEEFAPGIVARWGELCPRLSVLRLPARHRELFQGGALRVLTPALEEAVLAVGGFAERQDRGPADLGVAVAS